MAAYAIYLGPLTRANSRLFQAHHLYRFSCIFLDVKNQNAAICIAGDSSVSCQNCEDIIVNAVIVNVTVVPVWNVLNNLMSVMWHCHLTVPMHLSPAAVHHVLSARFLVTDNIFVHIYKKCSYCFAVCHAVSKKLSQKSGIDASAIKVLCYIFMFMQMLHMLAVKVIWYSSFDSLRM